jgi:pimeloyl-ACP methyl ester carboxylesterase
LPDECRMDTNSLRKYGEPPFISAVLHGGPGACGQMAPVARELASQGGVLEPLGRASSIEGQIQELRLVLEENGNLPVTLIGFSWGAWLGLVFCARYPELIRKLIIVGCGGLEDQDGEQTRETRIKRLGREEAVQLISLIEVLDDPEAEVDNAAYAILERLLLKTDAYNPIASKPNDEEPIDFCVNVFRSVWEQAAQLRRSGRLLEFARSIRCPVVAVHGDYDPHPARGVQRPLSAVIASFRFIPLKYCGHTPWIEEEARETFYKIMKEELSLNHRRVS